MFVATPYNELNEPFKGMNQIKNILYGQRK